MATIDALRLAAAAMIANERGVCVTTASIAAYDDRVGEVAYADLVEHVVTNPMLNGEVIRLDGALRMASR
jgi:hypothetical protein